jgi:hypothetical protein
MNDHSSEKLYSQGPPFVRAEICDICFLKSYVPPKGDSMRKIIFILCMVLFFYIPILSYAMDVSVDIMGPQDLGTLKGGIEKTIVARCIAKGIQLESYKKLNVTLSKLGDVISYDALLDSVPPKAFHKDLKDTSNLSGTIDEMIGAMFVAAPKTQAAIQAPSQQEPVQKNVAGAKLKLPFIANSIAEIGGKIFISDPNTVYALKGEKTSPIWHTPGSIEILRIYPYQDTLIVLGKLKNDFRSFKIKDGKTIERWDKAVVPLGKGLVVSELYSDKDTSSRPYTWLPVKQLAGSSPSLPKELDVIAAVTSETGTVSKGPEVLSFTQENHLTVYGDSSVLRKAEDNAGIVPEYIEDPTITPPMRYYLKPRIVVAGGKIVTFKNDQGLARWIARIPLFEASQIIVYSASGDEFEGTAVATFPKSYCADIALASGKVAALIVKEKYTYLQLLDL